MRSRRDRAFAQLVDGNGRVWLIWKRNSGELTASEYSDGALGPTSRLGFSDPRGFRSCVASDGVPWVVWQGLTGHVWTCRCVDGEWGSSLQVSAQPAKMLCALCIVPDAYGNVWIFWERKEPDAISVCRMGPRSGQETVVVQGEDVALLDAAISEGTLYVIYEDLGLHVRVAIGTEHGGFPTTINLPPG